MNENLIRMLCGHTISKTKEARDIVTLKWQTNYILKMLWRKISSYIKQEIFENFGQSLMSFKSSSK